MRLPVLPIPRLFPGAFGARSLTIFFLLPFSKMLFRPTGWQYVFLDWSIPFAGFCQNAQCFSTIRASSALLEIFFCTQCGHLFALNFKIDRKSTVSSPLSR